MKQFLYAIFFILFFIGCNNTSSSPTSYPSWYLSPPANTNDFLYAEGIGLSKEEAKQNALNTMAANLIVNVSSSIETNKETYSNGIIDGYNQSVKQNIQTNIKDIEFTNPTIVKSIFIQNEFIILLRVDKQKLYEKYMDRFTILDNKITLAYKNSQTIPPLEAIIELENIQADIKNNQINGMILNALNKNFSFQKYAITYENIKTLQKEYITNTPISISSNTKENVFLNQLAQELNRYGFKIKQNTKEIQIKLHNVIEYSKTRGWDIAKVNTTIKSYSNTQLVSTHLISSVGRSSNSKQLALQSARKDFHTKIKQKGIQSILFSK